jgi:hypothetical protein
MITFHSPYLNIFVRTSIVATLPLFLYSLGFFHKGERQFIHNAIRKGGNFMKVTVQSVIIR